MFQPNTLLYFEVHMALSSLKLFEHPLFNNVEIKLSQPGFQSNYKTVFIGPNGTGKSYLLSSICDIVIAELSSNKEKISKKLKYSYELALDNKTITNKSKSTNIKINRVIATTNTYNDRFYYPTKNGLKSIEQYKYLGLKSASNNIFFSGVKDDLFKCIVTIISDNRKCRSAVNVMNELNFNQKIKIIINKGKNFNKFTERTETTSLSDLSLNRFLETDYHKNKASEINKLIELMNLQKSIILDINLDEIQNYNDLHLFQSVIYLTDAKIFTVSKLSLFSKDDFDINDVSSGEFNILRTLLSITANVEDNSLILIDEPEISLHPNWQIEFCRYLDLALTAFKNCHTIISTHSHFIISNLQPDSSSVITLKANTKEKIIQLDNIEYNTYGLSPENTLYQLFGVTGFNNKYFEKDLRVIIDFISSQNSDRSEFKSAFDRVSKYKFDTTSPIVNILLKAKGLLQ